jgi:hypothetical protein
MFWFKELTVASIFLFHLRILYVVASIEAMGTSAEILNTSSVQAPCTIGVTGWPRKDNIPIEGHYKLVDYNHGKPSYRMKKYMTNETAAVYFWDSRDGPTKRGWWFGPMVGSDIAWAHHPGDGGSVPPCSGWCVLPRNNMVRDPVDAGWNRSHEGNPHMFSIAHGPVSTGHRTEPARPSATPAAGVVVPTSATADRGNRSRSPSRVVAPV